MKKINLKIIVPLFLLCAFAGFSLNAPRASNSMAPHAKRSAAPAWLQFQHPPADSIPAIIVSASSRGEVQFPHQFHIDEMEMACSDCHHETNAATLKTPHDEYFEDFWIDCAICHRKNGDTVTQTQSCSKCHHAQPAGIADETLSAKVVIHQSCWECHDVGTGQEASEGCAYCHTGERSKYR